MIEYMRHNILGTNPGAAPRTIGLNRGVVAAALMGIINFVLIFIPLDNAQKVEVIAATGPIVILLSYMIYGYFDQAAGKGGGDAG